MEDIGKLLVVALATWQAVEIWHHSILFAEARSKTECWQGGFKGWLGDLLACPWCTSVWVGFISSLVWLLPFPNVGRTYAADSIGITTSVVCGVYLLIGMSKIFVLGLAASRLANLGNDLYHNSCRTPRMTLRPDDTQKPELR